MLIQMKSVCPEPMREAVAGSQIWRGICDFPAGCKCQINAPSGRGKTSLVHFLAGLRCDYVGHILLDGVDIGGFTPRQWADLRRCRISVVFQDLRLLPELTVMHNLMLKAVLTNGVGEKEILPLLDRMGLGGYGKRRTGSLSQGEQQRVAICRALLQPCDVLLMDEPFSHLDRDNISAVCSCIREFCATRGAGIIMTSLGYDYPLDIDTRLTL